MVDRFYDWHGRIVDTCSVVDLHSYNKRPSAVAHSLGSWILGNAMLKFSDVRFNKHILADSILFCPATLIGVRFLPGIRSRLYEMSTDKKTLGLKWASWLVARTGTGGSEGLDWFDTTVDNIPLRLVRALRCLHATTHRKALDPILV
jgi:hypothetical protein